MKEQAQTVRPQTLSNIGSETNIPQMQAPEVKEKPVDISEFSGKSTATTAALTHKNSKNSNLGKHISSSFP